MFRGVLVAAAAVFACAPATGAIVYQKSGVAVVTGPNDGATLDIHYQPTAPGLHKFTMFVSGLDLLDAQGFGVVGVFEYSEWENGVLTFANDGNYEFNPAVIRDGNFYRSELDIPGLIDNRDASGTGTVVDYFYQGPAVFSNFYFQRPGRVEWTATIEANFADAAIPEPATWAMMIAGFGAVGAVARRRTLGHVTHA